MRLMSFALTTRQISMRTKTVTRRRGWKKLRPGDLFVACEKCQGLQRGERVRRLWVLRCVSNRVVRLDRITRADVAREGFPELTPAEFVAMFCRHMGGQPDQLVNRIAFDYVRPIGSDAS